MNGIIGGVLRCQRFIHSLAFTRQYTRWYRLQHLQTIKVNGYLYKTKDAKLANALSREIDTTDSGMLT